MAQTMLQFHAQNSEIVSFLRETVKKNNLRAFGVTFFPKYMAKEIFLSEGEKYEKYNQIIVCQSELEISNKKLYNEYLNKKCGDLIITLGRDDGVELVESGMGVVSDDGIDVLWKKIIAQFRKQLLGGTYIVAPNGDRRYYPKHWYTIGAKMAYEKGVIIRPIAGWNRYILEKADELQR